MIQETLTKIISDILPEGRVETTILPQCDDISLYLLNPDYPRCQLSREQGLRLMQEPLYWAFCWASGQAMARYMMDNPQLIKGKRVLDFGCGSGVKHFNVPCYRKIAALDSVTIPDLDESAEFGHVNIYHASQKKKSSTSIDKFSGAQM